MNDPSNLPPGLPRDQQERRHWIAAALSLEAPPTTHTSSDEGQQRKIHTLFSDDETPTQRPYSADHRTPNSGTKRARMRSRFAPATPVTSQRDEATGDAARSSAPPLTITDAARRMKEAERRAAEAERKLAQAERKVAEAEQRAEDAGRRARQRQQRRAAKEAEEKARQAEAERSARFVVSAHALIAIEQEKKATREAAARAERKIKEAQEKTREAENAGRKAVTRAVDAERRVARLEKRVGQYERVLADNGLR